MKLQAQRVCRNGGADAAGARMGQDTEPVQGQAAGFVWSGLPGAQGAYVDKLY